MKLNPLLLSLTLIITTAVWGQEVPKTVSQNILFEGGFQENSNGTPVGWTAGGFAGGDQSNTVKTTEERDGNYVSLFIKSLDKGMFNLNLVEPVQLKSTWKELLCSYDIRVFNFVQGPQGHHKPRMHLTFFDASGLELINTGVAVAGNLADAWQTAERKVPIPAGAASVKVWFGTFSSSGQLDFRNIYIAPLP